MGKVAKRWVRCAADERAVAAGCRFDERAAARAVDFFARFLRHSKGDFAGRPFELLDWQRDDVVYPLFGWKRADGTRRFRKLSLWVPKKNGKSTLAAGLGLYLLVGDGEPGAEIYSCGVDRDQAGLVHTEAIHMVEASPALSRYLSVNRTTKTITFLRERALYKALASDKDSKEGLNIHAAIIDELHAWTHGREFFDTLRYGGGARRQPLFVNISTAGVYDPHTIGWEEYEYARRVLGGQVEDAATLAVIYEAPADDDWTAPATWRKANPSLGVTLSLDEFEAAAREARQKPRLEAVFRRYRLNIWVQSAEGWLRMEDWDRGGEPITDAMLAGRACFAGIDLASRNDVAAVAWVFPPVEAPRGGAEHAEGKGGSGSAASAALRETPVEEQWIVLTDFFAPRDNAVRREQKDRVTYVSWAQRGFLTLTPGNVIDYTFIRQRVRERGRLWNVREIAYDPWGGELLCNQLLGGEDGFTVVEVRQGFASLSEPTKKLEELVLAGRLRHGGQPVLRWMAGNAQVDQDPAGNIKPSKKTSREKIDGISALVTALNRAIHGAGTPAKSVYEARGVRTIGK